jgi:hypothetical protein
LGQWADSGYGISGIRDIMYLLLLGM